MGITFNDARPELIQLIKEGNGRYKIAEYFNINPSKARRWIDKIRRQAKDADEAEAWEANVVLSKQKQKQQDRARIANKLLRESSRVQNAVVEYASELINVLNKYKFEDFEIVHTEEKGKAVGIIHLSDIHFNELINIPNNKYDFNVASIRLKLLADRAKKYFSIFNINTVLIACTGDFLNSDRRLDEMLSMATNRAKASFLAIDILRQFILDINSEFNIVCACVTGNESRMTQEIGYSEEVATDSYDVTIFNTLSYLFNKCKGIKFLRGDCLEQVINIAGQNILMLHGHTRIAKQRDIQKATGQVMGTYSARGINIDFIIFGHMHSAYISDNFARCASVAGANAYSEMGLNLSTRASQNLYIIHEDGSRDGIKVDLQEASCSGYNIDSSLESYNAKSADKLKEHKTIFEITI